MRYAFIVNPRAKRTGAGRLAENLESALRNRGLDYRLLFVERRGQGGELARRAVADGADAVVAVGGDGTINEVLNGLDDRRPLGIVPVGTCNDIARNLGLPHRDWHAALDVIAAGRTRRIDVARCNERRFLSVAGSGLDGCIGVAVNRIPRLLRNPAWYVVLLFRYLLTQRPVAFRLIVDGEVIEQDAWMVAVANTEAYAGGMRIAPRARPDDGRLHVCIVGKASRLELLRRLPLVYSGRHTTHPIVRMLEGKTVEVTCARPCRVIADGEDLGWLPLEIGIAPQAIPVFLAE
jgi:diacylglycerol kinase (ATP)